MSFKRIGHVEDFFHNPNDKIVKYQCRLGYLDLRNKVIKLGEYTHKIKFWHTVDHPEVGPIGAVFRVPNNTRVHIGMDLELLVEPKLKSITFKQVKYEF
jgi:hypothetical protein